MKQLSEDSADSHGFYIKFVLNETKLGRSLIAKEYIKAGKVIWEDRSIDTIAATKEEILSWPEAQRKTFCDYSWQEEENLFRGTYNKENVDSDASNFINHNCDPSCWFVTDKHIAARRDIFPGEEITIDYATTDTIFVTIPECKCESPFCRKEILPTDYRLPALQKAYGSHFRFFLLRRLLKEGFYDKESNMGCGIMYELHKDVRLKESPIHGKGLYAGHSIPAGTVVWQANEPVDDLWIELDEAQVLSVDPAFSHVVTSYFEMAPNGKYRGPKFAESIERDASNFFNHTCNPNIWFEGDDRLVTMRDIRAGEELAYDYATAKRLYTKSFACHCGTASCRKQVSYEDYKLPELRKKYGHHFVSHWLNLMALENDVALV